MGYRSSADGVAKTGKTNTKIFPNSGAKKGMMGGGKKATGVTSEKMKAVGRGLAKVANQGG
jgi:hypothetical protein